MLYHIINTISYKISNINKSNYHNIVKKKVVNTVNSRCNAVFGVHKIRTAVLRMRGIKIRPVS